MPNLTANEIVTSKHVRNFIQYGGARPNNGVQYSGQDAQYLAVMGVSTPDNGTVNPIWVKDPRRIGFYRLVGRSRAPANLSTARLMIYEKHGAIPRQLRRNNCELTLYDVVGDCKDLSDFVAGWSDYVLIYSGGLVDAKDLGDRTPFTVDNPLEDGLAITWADIYPMGALAFGAEAAVEITREAVDVVYGSNQQCGDCGPFDDGTNRIYAVNKSSGTGSPGLPSHLVFSTDGGATWTQRNIDGMTVSEDPLAIDIAGDKLVVIGTDAYFWSQINAFTGVPGTFTKVTTGFVAAKSPRDLYVLNPREVFFVGDGGYIYKSSDVTQGVTTVDAAAATSVALKRISGDGNQTLVAVGATSTVIYSTNRGQTWSTTATSPAAASTLQAVAVLDKLRWWVGSAGGKMFFTLNGGATWTEKTFTGSGGGQVRDIVFANDEVGYMLHDTATPIAYLWATWNGGANWTRSDAGSPRIGGWPVFNIANRIAFPQVSDNGVAVNNVAVAGLAADALDGLVMLGIAGFV